MFWCIIIRGHVTQRTKLKYSLCKHVRYQGDDNMWLYSSVPVFWRNPHPHGSFWELACVWRERVPICPPTLLYTIEGLNLNMYQRNMSVFTCVIRSWHQNLKCFLRGSISSVCPQFAVLKWRCQFIYISFQGHFHTCISHSRMMQPHGGVWV